MNLYVHNINMPKTYIHNIISSFYAAKTLLDPILTTIAKHEGSCIS